MEKIENYHGTWFKLRDLWSLGPEGYEWLVYTVCGVLLYRLIRYLIQVLEING